jgi:exodeoxyribonuclease VII large subunit
MNPIRLTDFARMLETGIREKFGFQSYWITGEISNLKIYDNKGHLYFHMVEKDASTGIVSAELSCVGFNAGYSSMRAFEETTQQSFCNGIEVLVQVNVSFHPVKGLKLQLLQVDVNFSAGKIQQQRQLALKKLIAENADAAQILDGRLFTRNQSLKLPLAFRRIAVISSDQSAGYQDFVHTLDENPFGYKIQTDLFATVVQGEANVNQLVSRLVEIFSSKEPYDAVILVRGGGSQTDFLLYDAYSLVKAVARFPIPVITGLGHLKDISLTDMVAHTSLKTPTMVAEFLIAQNKAFEEKLLSIRQQIVIKVQKLMLASQESLAEIKQEIRQISQERCSTDRDLLAKLKGAISNDALKFIRKSGNQQIELSRRISTLPGLQIQRSKANLFNTLRGIQTAALQFHRSKQSELSGIETVIRILGPEATMKRGFAMVLKNGKVINEIDQIASGDEIQINLIGGKADATIYNTKPNGKD